MVKVIAGQIWQLKQNSRSLKVLHVKSNGTFVYKFENNICNYEGNITGLQANFTLIKNSFSSYDIWKKLND